MMVSPGTFLYTGKYAAHHHHIGSGGQGLYHIACITDAAICNNRYIPGIEHRSSFHNGGYLGNTRAGDDTCSTDRTRADTDLHCVCTRIRQGLGAGGSTDITGNDLQTLEGFFSDLSALMTPIWCPCCAVQGYDVHADLL